MQQFIPFEDDWDALEKMHLDALIPYRVGLVPVHEADQPRPEAFSKAPDGALATPK